MDDFSGFAPGTGDLLRLIGVGWIGALLVAGVTILAARWLLNWQLRRIGRAMGPNEGEAAEGQQSAGIKPESP